jgi:SAM-dependent methyltransferase
MIHVDRSEIDLMAAVEDRLWWYVGMRAITRALLDRHLGPVRDLRILDAGCGTGANARFLSDWGRVSALDLDRYALGWAQRTLAGGPAARLAQADTGRLPFPAGAFDLVTSFDVLPMLPPGADRAALAELTRVLRPGGWSLVRVAAHDWLRRAHDRFWRNTHRYSHRELGALIGAAGLTVVHSGYLNTWVFPLVVLKRRLEPFLPPPVQSDLALTPGWLNRALSDLLTSETAFFLRGWLPTGLSLMTLARKPGGRQ